MRQQISFLTQSRFYSPAFNAAIFDGPIRIYFAQYQEPLALKVYFMTQDRLKHLYNDVREAFRRTGVNIFVMLYPSEEAFNLSFSQNEKIEGTESSLPVIERLGSDFVIGARGPLSSENIESIYNRIEEVAKTLVEFEPPMQLQVQL